MGGEDGSDNGSKRKTCFCGGSLKGHHTAMANILMSWVQHRLTPIMRSIQEKVYSS